MTARRPDPSVQTQATRHAPQARFTLPPGSIAKIEKLRERLRLTKSGLIQHLLAEAQPRPRPPKTATVEGQSESLNVTLPRWAHTKVLHLGEL